jgi:hypothetical protein
MVYLPIFAPKLVLVFPGTTSYNCCMKNPTHCIHSKNFLWSEEHEKDSRNGSRSVHDVRYVRHRFRG